MTAPSSDADIVESASDGITSVIRGTVAGVQMASQRRRATPATAATFLTRLKHGLLPFPAPAYAVGGIENIEVGATGYDARAVTDTDGSFSLTDVFEGPLTLSFERFEDGLLAYAKAEVPAGGTLTLEGIQIDEANGVAEAAVQRVAFDGAVLGKACLLQELIVANRNDPSRWYRVNLVGSSIQDQAGSALSCPELSSGIPVRVDGIFRPDGSIGEASIVTE